MQFLPVIEDINIAVQDSKRFRTMKCGKVHFAYLPSEDVLMRVHREYGVNHST